MCSSLRKKAAAGLKPGDTFELTRTFTRAETVAFGDLTRDYNPVHYDERWTQAKGFDSLICHGLLVGGMICEFGGQVGWLATGMDFTFIKPVYINDTIRCRIRLQLVEDGGRAAAEAEFTNQHGIRVARAFLKGRLPVRSEQAILAQMMTEGDPTNPLAKTGGSIRDMVNDS